MIQILVIEDDPDLLFLYGEAIIKPGRVVTNAADGVIAAALLEESDYTPDVVFLDINMVNGVSGFRILEIIRNTPRLQQAEVVVVTANEQHKLYALSKGAHYFRVKPFNVEDITALADELCAPYESRV